MSSNSQMIFSFVEKLLDPDILKYILLIVYRDIVKKFLKFIWKNIIQFILKKIKQLSLHFNIIKPFEIRELFNLFKIFENDEYNKNISKQILELFLIFKYYNLYSIILPGDMVDKMTDTLNILCQHSIVRGIFEKDRATIAIKASVLKWICKNSNTSKLHKEVFKKYNIKEDDLIYYKISYSSK